MVIEKEINSELLDLENEFIWFVHILDNRLQHFFDKDIPLQNIEDSYPLYGSLSTSSFSRFIAHYECTPSERLVVMLCLAVHLKPALLDVFYIKNALYDRPFTEFGGQRGNTHSGFLPTAETALFLLAGTNLQDRIKAERLFDVDHYFAAHQILALHPAAPHEPFFSGLISISIEIVSYLIGNTFKKPHFSLDFPAKNITTPMNWEDLVLSEGVLEQIDEIKAWVHYSDTLMGEWGFHKTLKPGFKTLFYGPPGTGKTLVASLLGKICKMEVYRIDLSLIVSKYIGETEKNLGKVFQMAENKNWILFFDEADALFGKRTGVNDSHDRYANQETSYLLQRIEDFNGLIILATNLKSNIDEAFARRFGSVIYFPIPEPKERLRLWQNSFSACTQLEDKIDLEQIALQYELAGGTILNIIRYCSLMALSQGENIIRLKYIENGIRKELMKEGKVI